jgi:hypothetical protein
MPVLLLATLHDEVLRDPACELAGWYASVARTPRDDDVTAALLAHCRRRRDAIVGTVSTRSTQTNEVGRCGVLLPALGMVAREVGELALVDVGTSAGLNLLPDRYRYRDEPGGSVGPDAAVEITVGTRGAVPVPVRVPRIAARIGLDREPIDIFDDDASRVAARLRLARTTRPLSAARRGDRDRTGPPVRHPHHRRRDRTRGRGR